MEVETSDNSALNASVLNTDNKSKDEVLAFSLLQREFLYFYYIYIFAALGKYRSYLN